MQKLDFINSIETIVKELKSEDIILVFNEGLKSVNTQFQYGRINSLLFSSKSNYDKIKDDARYSTILDTLSSEDIYSEFNLAALTSYLITNTAALVMMREKVFKLYNYHYTLMQLLYVSQNVLQNSNIADSFIDDANNGIIVFQVIIDNDGLPTERYIKIFSVINELTETVSKILDEEQKSEIILLDSGSDTNIGLKTGIETAKSLFLIFKEVWDFVTNYKQYRQKQRNDTLLECLSVIEEIKKKVQSNVISEDEGKEYIHIIKTRTDELIGMKVLPKKLAREINFVDSKRILSELEGVKLLTGGK